MCESVRIVLLCACIDILLFSPLLLLLLCSVGSVRVHSALRPCVTVNMSLCVLRQDDLNITRGFYIFLGK